MKRSAFLLVALSSGVLLTACSSTVDPSASLIEEKPVIDESPSADDHHAGEKNVMPHDDMMEDHHAGEENVKDHGHDEVEPHDDSDQPPHRH